MTVLEQIEHWITMNVMDEIILADGFEEAFLGVSEVFGRPPLATYDRDKCIEIIIANSDKNGLTDEEAYAEAEEYFDFNVTSAWVGENTPIYLTLWKSR